MLLPDSAILGHVTSCLPHKPDWRAVDRLSLAGADKVRMRGRHELLNLASLAEICCEDTSRASPKSTKKARRKLWLVESVDGMQSPRMRDIGRLGLVFLGHGLAGTRRISIPNVLQRRAAYPAGPLSGVPSSWRGCALSAGHIRTSQAVGLGNC